MRMGIPPFLFFFDESPHFHNILLNFMEWGSMSWLECGSLVQLFYFILNLDLYYYYFKFKSNPI
jgi:hypothetical protein